jgi:hypothetical protein
MDIHLLKDEGVQRKLRSILGEILIKEGLELKQLGAQIAIGSVILTRFLRADSKQQTGIRALLKIAHYLSKNGYDLNILTQE